MRKRRRWVVAAIIALILAAAFIAPFLLSRLAPRYEPGEATGEPLDIRLVEIWPLDGPDVLDADGKKIGETLGLVDAFRPQEDPPAKRVMFVLDIPPEVENLVFSSRRSIGSCDGDRRGRRDYSSYRVQAVGSRLYHYVDLRPYMHVRGLPFPFERFMKPRLEERTYTRVDYTVYFWYGPPGKAAATVAGPFEPGRKLSGTGPVPYDLEASAYYGTTGRYGTLLALSLSGAAGTRPEILCYDMDGKRHVPNVRYGPQNKAKGGITARVEGLMPRDIAFITIGEQPREKTFRNIAVAWPGRPTYTRPAHWDEFVERLGLGEIRDSRLEYYDFESAADALKVLDIVRGGHIEPAWSKIINQRVGLDFAALEEGDRRKLLSAARSWARSVDPFIRRCGADLGMRLDFHEFAPAALELLGTGPPRVRRDLLYEFSRHADDLTPAELDWLKGLLLSRDTPEVHRRLVACMRDCPLAETAGVFREFAWDERPWIWWIVFATDEGRKVLGDEKDWPREFKVRALIAEGFEDGERFGEDVAAEARLRLPRLLSPDLASIDSGAFFEIFNTMVRQCDPETVMGAIGGFLVAVKDPRAAGDGIALVVRFINGEYGLDIARLGGDTAAPLDDEYAFNWRQIADDALEWMETAKLPPEVPPGHRAGERDIRIVLKDNRDAEKSDVTLWVCEETPRAGRVRMVASEGRRIFFEIGADTSAPQLSYKVEMGASFITGGRTFRAAELPLTLYEREEFAWIFERADSPESVLSGTKVFADWWEKYGPEDAQAPQDDTGK